MAKNLTQAAREMGVSLAALLKANPGIRNPNIVTASQLRNLNEPRERTVGKKESARQLSRVFSAPLVSGQLPGGGAPSAPQVPTLQQGPNAPRFQFDPAVNPLAATPGGREIRHRPAARQQRTLQSPDVAIRTGQIAPTAFDSRLLQAGRGTNRADDGLTAGELSTSRVSGAGLVIDPFGFSTSGFAPRKVEPSPSELLQQVSGPRPFAQSPDVAQLIQQREQASRPGPLGATGGFGVSPDVALQTGQLYTGPTGQVGPNQFVVTDLSDVGLIARGVPGADIFFSDQSKGGQLRAVSGTAAFIPALNRFLAGGVDLPQSVIDTLVRAGLLAPTDDFGFGGGGGGGTGSGGGGGGFRGGGGGRFPTGRFSSLGLVMWRI